MKEIILQYRREKLQKWYRLTRQLTDWFQQSIWKIICLSAICFLFSQKDLNLQIDFDQMPFASILAVEKNDNNNAKAQAVLLKENSPYFGSTVETQPISYAQFSTLSALNTKPTAPVSSQSFIQKEDDNLANTYSNLNFEAPKKKKAILNKGAQNKRTKQLAYISRFAHVAKAEMAKFGIPASITLAQGLLESNVGESRLATNNQNHFGVKCFSKSCRKGHCSNFSDDSHKDFFRIYNSAWESYRAHSLILGGKRYKHLKKLGTKDYKNWAHGLKKAGYATDKRYAFKLIRLIEALDLQKYD